MLGKAFRYMHFLNDSGQNPAVLPVVVPEVPRLQQTFRRVTLQDVINPPAPIFHEGLVDKRAFRHSYAGDRDVVLKLDLFIKAPDTDIHVPEALRPALPFIRDVFRIQAQQGYDVRDLWAQMFITQGYIEPHQTLATTAPHIDMNLGRILKGTDDNARHYLASNIFTTDLFDQPIQGMPKDLQFMPQEHTQSEFQRCLRAHTTSTAPVFAKPYQIAEAESVLVHAECRADFRAYRTFMMIAMRPRDILSRANNLQTDINNTGLFAAIQSSQGAGVRACTL